MDIPTSGAIFTLGKSYLAENTQSYFYIKNDPVKRLISGPHQSAVICESGRLFVWGENYYGQLGIGGHGAHHHHHHNSNNNNNNNNGEGSAPTNDIISKPTCVKSLKTLGLKVCDAAFGNNWAIILTFSNEIFYTGRNIFPNDTPVASNFTTVLMDDEEFGIIRKPFRLEEFDDYLSKSEETDNFISVLAGNEHFAVLTTTGRLIGCGSNVHQQLGELEADYDGHPVEITLDAPVKQFACGPESTLVLTETGNLFLTGRLNEFVFPKFTELQKNLSAAEQIIFMHITNTSEIYIVTNLGNIFRSFESLRNKSLVFQRFYDYDSEENGPIWKLLKGFSFYAVLTKANKFFTTFSESGHHLKTFREISKFKNLRLLDIAVGAQHILVHGIPRGTALSATIASASGEHTPRSLVRQKLLANDAVAAATAMRSSSGRSIRKEVAEVEHIEHALTAMKPSAPPMDTDVNHTSKQEEHESNNNENTAKITIGEAELNNNNETHSVAEQQSKKDRTVEPEKAAESSTNDGHKSPTDSVRSHKSARSIKFDTAALQKSTSNTVADASLRPRTPYPGSSNASTPQTVKKTPMRNFSYEAAIAHDHLDRTSPELVDCLESVEENFTAELSQAPPITNVSTPTPPTEDDEQLTVEITTTKDANDDTKEINEIRFINNGVDVTEKVKEQIPDTPVKSSIEELESDAENALQEVDEHIEKVAVATKEKAEEMSKAVEKLGGGMAAKLNETNEEVKEKTKEIEKAAEKLGDKMTAKLNETGEQVSDNIGDKIEAKLSETRDSMQTVMRNAVTGARDSIDAAGSNAKRIAAGAMDVVGDNARRMATGARGAVDTVGENAKRMAAGALDAVDTAGENAKRMANNAIKSVEEAGSSAAKAADDTKEAMKHAVGSVTTKISSEMQEAKQNISTLFQIKSVKDAVRDREDDASSKEGPPKTGNTNGSGGEDDERTTASVNSNHTSTGNPFESNGNGNPFESTVNKSPIDDLDAIVERGKKAMQEDLRRQEQERLEHANVHAHRQHAQAEETVQESKSKVRQFFDDVRNKGLSCRSEKAIQIDDEPPPHFTKNKVNSEISLHNGHGHGDQNSSRVCTIL